MSSLPQGLIVRGRVNEIKLGEVRRRWDKQLKKEVGDPIYEDFAFIACGNAGMIKVKIEEGHEQAYREGILYEIAGQYYPATNAGQLSFVQKVSSIRALDPKTQQFVELLATDRQAKAAA